MAGLLPWDSSEFDAWRDATRDAVDGHHIPSRWCGHCAQIQRLRSALQSDHALMIRWLELRRHRERLLERERRA